MNVLRLPRASVWDMLSLEEALYRSSTSNWCVMNQGSSPPLVVMGISGKPQKMLDVDAVKR
jgi:lipoate-protein ligase A